jgi:hypothetical protein
MSILDNNTKIKIFDELLNKKFLKIEYELDGDSMDYLMVDENFDFSKLNGEITCLRFWLTNNKYYLMYPDLMYLDDIEGEDIALIDIIGDLNDIINHPLLEVEKVSNYERYLDRDLKDQSWTFYKFSTIKGSVTLRWCGKNNNGYSIDVFFFEY